MSPPDATRCCCSIRPAGTCRKAGRAKQHHHRAVAGKVPRAEPAGECLAVHARQLALQPRVRERPRPCRSLLPRPEQIGGPTLADYVDWHARLGASVLITESWYKAQCRDASDF